GRAAQNSIRFPTGADMLTTVNSYTIEGYTVYQDDANNLESQARQVRKLIGDDKARFQKALDAGGWASPTGNKVPPPDDNPPPKSTFWVLSKDPTLAIVNGLPAISLIVYREEEDRIDPDAKPGTDVGGGILTMTVELKVPDEVLKRIGSKLKAII